MKFFVYLTIALTVTNYCCTPSPKREGNTDSTSTGDSTLSLLQDETLPIPEETKKRLVIGYVSTAYKDGQQFLPFKKIYVEQMNARKIRDSLFRKNNEGPFSHDDSTLFTPPIIKAYQSILKYKEQLVQGISYEKVKAPPPNALTSNDESHNYLKGSASTTLNGVDFMILGGSPFVWEDPELHKSPDGYPEAHYATDMPENCEYFFNYLYSRHPGPITVKLGNSLDAYYGTDIEIKGIGSLHHELTNRIPVCLLTSAGIVPATLISTEMKFGDTYDCSSYYARYTFACSRNVNRESIFGIFYSDKPLVSERAHSYQEPGSAAWEYDIDGDSNADFIRVESTASGASSEELVQVIWYARINGEWVAVDHASQPDCT